MENMGLVKKMAVPKEMIYKVAGYESREAALFFCRAWVNPGGPEGDKMLLIRNKSGKGCFLCKTRENENTAEVLFLMNVSSVTDLQGNFLMENYHKLIQHKKETTGENNSQKTEPGKQIKFSDITFLQGIKSIDLYTASNVYYGKKYFDDLRGGVRIACFENLLAKEIKSKHKKILFKQGRDGKVSFVSIIEGGEHINLRNAREFMHNFEKYNNAEKTVDAGFLSRNAQKALSNAGR